MFLAANPSLCISLDKPEIYGKCCTLSAIKKQQKQQQQQKRNKKQLQQFNVNLKSKEKSNVKAKNVVQLMMLKGLSNDMCVRE